METKVAKIAAAPEPAPAKLAPVPPAQGASAAEPQSGSDPVDLRLVIEQDHAHGGYVYKTVNRVTGEVILSLPRDEVLRLRDHRGYAAGQVVQAKA